MQCQLRKPYRFDTGVFMGSFPTSMEIVSSHAFEMKLALLEKNVLFFT